MRWSNCHICDAEEDKYRDIGDKVIIYECQECGHEYCNKCGTTKDIYICNICLDNRKVTKQELLEQYAQFSCKFNKKEICIGCGSCLCNE